MDGLIKVELWRLITHVAMHVIADCKESKTKFSIKIKEVINNIDHIHSLTAF